jgi:lysine-specific demethylase 8
MTLGEFVGRMGGGERCYIDQVLVGFFDGLAGDFRFEDFQPPDVKDIVFWLGSGTRSGLHYDHVENFFAQVCGTKLAILAAPEEVRNLHVFPDSHTKSQVAPEHPDLAAHPRLGLATFQQATLEPGDVLYLPKGWWHYFASSPDSISLACWHDEPLTPAYDVKMVLASRNWALLARTFRDFFWHGVLGRPYRRRLYSPAPTGVMLHDLLSRLIPLKLPKSKTPAASH